MQFAMKTSQALVLILPLAFACLLPCASRADAGPATQKATPTALSSNPYSQTPSQHSASLKLPDRFTSYASEPIGDNRVCVAGRTTDADGMNQKPVAYVVEQPKKRVFWVARLGVPTDMYQSRATHCTRHGDSLYILMQSDTQSEQSLSQTLLRVVKLDATSGTVQLQQDVDVPAAYSVWVDEGANHFAWNGDRLVITGHDRLDADHDRQGTFTLRLNDDLKP
jgi:hypothetical protein